MDNGISSQFYFKVVHVPGKKVVADTLSQGPDMATAVVGIND